MSTEDEFERMWYPQNLNLVTKSIERDGEKKGVLEKVQQIIRVLHPSIAKKKHQIDGKEIKSDS